MKAKLTLESVKMLSNKKVSMQQLMRNWTGKIFPFFLVALVAFAFGVKSTTLTLPWSAKNPTTSQLPAHLDYSSIDEVYQTIKKHYDNSSNLTESQLIDGMKKGLAQATGDPYTVYFTAKDRKEFDDDLQGKVSGVGIELAVRNQQLTVVSPVDNTPASKAGLKAGDIIAKINGQDTTGWTADQASEKIKGKMGTKVTLTIHRQDQTLPFTLTREDFSVPSVTYKVENGIGYLEITRFAEDTSAKAQEAAAAFQQQHVKGVVLDLRGDGGGYLTAAVDVASLWLNNQVVVQERKGSKVIETSYSHNDATLKGLPTAVLIDGNSASASEIVAGALQDHHAATLIGEKSFGKGSVQQLFPMQDGSEVKVTLYRWYTPNGKNIDKQGITPSQVVKMTDDDINAGRDPQKDSAYSFINTRQ